MLADYELPFRELIDAAPDGLVVCDRLGVITLVNAEAERMFGYARDELRGKAIETLIPEHALPRHGRHLAHFVAAPRLRPMGSDLDLRGRRRDGSEFPIEISLSPIQTPRGLLITAGIRDVTDRRRLERDNRRANAYLVSAVEAVQDAFILFDEQDVVSMVNSAARQLLGGAGESIIGLSFAAVLAGALDRGVFDLGGEPRDALHQRWIDYHRAPSGMLDVRTASGRHLRVTERTTTEHGTVVTIADVTDDVERAAELDHAREAAESASAAKSEFLSSMSHELRTPLNAILGFAQLLERDRKRPLDERQLERLGYVLRGGEHLLRLIDDVLDLSRIEAGRLAVSSEPVDVAAVLSEVIHTLEPMAARASVQIAVEPLPPGLPCVTADRTRLAQVLMNFGSNAIKYGRADGLLTYRVELAGDHLRIVARDDGPGIPEDKRARIFEPFQRAGQEVGPIEGTGIGLTISKRLAELMHGRIGFTSELGRGSEFWIELVIHAAISEPAEPPASDPVSRLATGSRRHLVVYVEDNPSNLAFMRDLIDQLPDVALMCAPTAEIGLEVIRAHLPQVVIMDINLPGLNGFEAVKRLRAWPETRGIPVIGLSAAALAEDATRARDAGFSHYLTKPVKVAELTETLEQLVLGPRLDPRR